MVSAGTCLFMASKRLSLACANCLNRVPLSSVAAPVCSKAPPCSARVRSVVVLLPVPAVLVYHRQCAVHLVPVEVSEFGEKRGDHAACLEGQLGGCRLVLLFRLVRLGPDLIELGLNTLADLRVL